MGRLIAFVLFIALLAPGVLLARAWWLASGQRAVASTAVALAEPTPEGETVLRRQAQHGRRVRAFGWLLGVAMIVGSLVLFAESSVFLWVPALLLGLLSAVLLAEVSRPRPRWALASPVRRPRRGELVSGALVWTMRAVVLAEVAAAVSLSGAGEIGATVTAVAIVVPVLAWLVAEAAMLRAVLRPLPAQGADVPLDEALRTWTAHLVTGAASVLALLPLGTLLLIAGIELGDRVTARIDLLPVALVAGGFSALAAGIAVAGFLLTWLRPVRADTRALTR